MEHFELVSQYAPTGDQPQAIEELVNGFKEEWFPPINDALKKRIRHFLKVWNIPDSSVKTLNADGAYAEGIHVSIDG